MHLKKPEDFSQSVSPISRKANARDVRNYLEKAISNQATRIVGLKDVDKNILAMLEKEDLVGIEL